MMLYQEQKFSLYFGLGGVDAAPLQLQCYSQPADRQLGHCVCVHACMCAPALLCMHAFST